MGPGCIGFQPEPAARPALAAPSASRPERPVPRIRIGPALPDRKSLDAEIARLRDLGVSELRGRWHTVFGRQPPPHLPRHLLFRVLVYRLQADQLGDLDAETASIDPNHAMILPHDAEHARRMGWMCDRVVEAGGTGSPIS